MTDWFWLHADTNTKQCTLICCYIVFQQLPLSKMIHVLQHIYCPIHSSSSCFHLCWVSFVGFEPEFGIGKTNFYEHNMFTNSVGSLNPVLRLLQSLTFRPLCLHNHPHLYGFFPDNLWDEYKNRPLLFSWTHSSLRVSQPSESWREWPISASFNQKYVGICRQNPVRISPATKLLH